MDFTWNSVGIQCFLSVIAVCLVLQTSHAKKIEKATEENCEVCVKFLGKFIDSMDSETQGNMGKIDAAFRKLCKTAKKDDNRFCYYVGALEESATGMLGDLTKPVSWGVPADKVCMKLYRKDEQICDLKYDVQLDLATLDLKKLRVNALKQILSDWEEACRGCTEKSDFVELIEELMPKHAPEAYAKRQQLKQEL